MKIIIPMAGRGTRLRPHTLTVPKPLVKVVGKPIVQRLVESLAASFDEKLEEVAFIIGPDFGEDTERDLKELATKLGAKGSIYYQDEKLGTAHAILCAGESLSGNLIVAFADTLFHSDFTLDTAKDGVIWVQKVEDPRAYGVIKMDENNVITDFVEKPQEFVSDLAIIGIYYFKNGDELKSELQYLIDNDLKEKGEYQLTNALENLKQKGRQFVPATIDEWLDCGNKKAVVHANQRVLEHNKGMNLVSEKAKVVNSTIIQPCFIADGAEVQNSVVGPYVSIGKNSKISDSVISNSVVQEEACVCCVVMENSMVGNKATFKGSKNDLSVGDFTEINL